ncbi:sensor histidine kinase [Spongiimicrobium salis]|uniref:sensor histidine kinase n=1 Tax=Spongiimicrobium salis TaxID=1667022 RepID=UPI00374D3253
MKKEIVLILAFYLVMGIMNYVALVIDLGRWINPSGTLINYLLKAVLTLPLLWVFFRKLASSAIWKKGLLHLLTMCLFTYIWIKTYYLLCDSLGIVRLQGQREVWDVYLTLLFYGIQFGIFHVYIYSGALKKQELLSAELSKLHAESELAALKAQLNPHFLYNIFNTINAAIPTTAKNARNMVNELSDLFRYQLKASREEMIPLLEELHFVRKYLDLEKERFGERLQYTINAPAALTTLLIPPLILQPLVENSIKHGISPLIEGGEIQIDVIPMKDELQLLVCDTGKGINVQEKSALFQKGVGLSNTNARLLKMYGKGLELKKNTPTGLCISFSIPVHNISTLS